MPKKWAEKLVCIICILAISAGGITSVFNKTVVMLDKKGIISLSEDDNSEIVKVDWNTLYPIKEENTTVKTEVDNTETQNANIITKYCNAVEKVEDMIDSSINFIAGYTEIMEFNGAANKLLGKKIFSGVNSVIQLNNGYLASAVDKYADSDVKRIADNISGLSAFCDGMDIPFAYVQTPEKISKYDDELPVGVTDYANYNCDVLLEALGKRAVPTIDFRENIHNSDLEHYSLFYKTDHHWTVDTGRIAAGWLGEYLNKDFGFKLDTSLVEKSKYTEKTYKDIFFGSLGKKVTLGYASPEDFSVSLPTFDTDFRVVVQDKNLDLTGDFASVMYDKERAERVDYYDNSQYEAMLYGNRPLARIYNKNNPNGPKILLVRDSFSLALAPYLSLMAGEVDLIDIRQNNGNFNGSVKTFIEEEKPDMVIVMYKTDETIQ